MKTLLSRILDELEVPYTTNYVDNLYIMSIHIAILCMAYNKCCQDTISRQQL